MRAILRPVLVAGLALTLLGLFFRNADLARVWQEMQAARVDLLVLSVALTATTYFVRAERWQYLLEPLGKTRFWVAFRTTVIGFAVSFVLPARAGEVLRPYLLARTEGISATATFATIIVERMLDLVAVLALLGAFFVAFAGDTAASAPGLYRAVALGGLLMAPLGFGVLAAMFAVAGHPERVHGLMMRAERVLPARLAHAVAGFTRTFAQGLAVVRRPSRLVLASAWSLVLWLVIALQVWVIAVAFGIRFPFSGAFLIMAMLVVGVSIPTPGGVGGTHEAFRLGVTSFYGADNDAAIGAAILQHAVNFAPVTLLGLWFLARDGLSMARLREMASQGRPSSGEPASGEVPS
ncbi:MAG: lysylphosphatidylglycerol synthase transmembrane domain-containing protein [Acidobacteriota bacterium]